MQQYEITGMSCAACSARIEKAVSALDGVKSCSVSLLTNSMAVEGNTASNTVIETVEALGYGIKSKDALYVKDKDDFLKDTETPALKRRLVYSLGFLAALMYVSMGYVMWGFPLPVFFIDNPLAVGLLQLILCTIVMIINKKFFTSGFKAAINKSPNMDTLVALGSGASYLYSLYALFAMTSAYKFNDISMAHHYLHELYFESAGMILVLITVGKMLEAYSKGKTTNALKGLVKLKPKTAIVIFNNEEKEIIADNIKVGDVFIVKQGEKFPTDGIIIEGQCSTDESALTGESIPVDKLVGDSVSAATINTSGYVKCKATKTSDENILAQIIKMVSDAAATKAPIAKVADKVSGVFVPIVIVVAVLSAIVWILAGESFGFALARGISVLVISCPCALGLATPVAIMVGSGIGAKSGILFKTAAALEEIGRIRTVALDKTGTITSGNPVVTDLIPASNVTEDQLLKIAYALEIKSEHPLAKAIVKEAEIRETELLESSDFISSTGNGLEALIDGKLTYGGKFAYVLEKCRIPNDVKELSYSLSDMGKTPLFFSCNGEFIGVIAVADSIKADSPKAIAQLKAMGIKTVMITGDNQKTANAVKLLCGVDEVVAEVLPNQKAEVIREIKKRGKIAMVGDGINDAPALASADTGIAIGTGTDIAIDSADVVLMNSNLLDVPAAIRLGRASLKNIYENLFWAFIYNIIGIPLAAGIWIPLFGLKLNPMFGAAAMSLSSFCVVANALRLNFFKPRDNSKDKKFKLKENRTMEKVIKIEGMMCGHCEARVKQILEGIDGVVLAQVSHEDNCAKITVSKDVSDEVIKKAIEEQGYKVL